MGAVSTVVQTILSAIGTRVGLTSVRLAAMGSRLTGKIAELYAKNAAKSLPMRKAIFSAKNPRGQFLRDVAVQLGIQVGIEASMAAVEEFIFQVIAKAQVEGTDYGDAIFDLILSSDPKDDVLRGLGNVMGKSVNDVSGLDKTTYLAVVASVLIGRSRAAKLKQRFKKFDTDTVQLHSNVRVVNINTPSKTAIIVGTTKHTMASIAYNPLTYVYGASAINGVVSGVTGEETKFDLALNKFDEFTDLALLVSNEEVASDSETVIVNSVKHTIANAQRVSKIAETATKMVVSKDFVNISSDIDNRLLGRMDSADLRLARVRKEQDGDGFIEVKI